MEKLRLKSFDSIYLLVIKIIVDKMGVGKIEVDKVGIKQLTRASLALMV